jgi:transglutaminase-like putative cysteine protease
MARLAQEGKTALPIRTLAVNLTRGLPQKHYVGEARACLEYCRDRIRYVKDIRGVETLHDPVTLLKTGAGDCDDKSILLASMLMSIGHRCRFVAVSLAPGQFSHVWVQVNIRGKWIDLEPTEPLQFGERIPSDGILRYIYQDC